MTSDESASAILATILKHPITAASMFLCIIASTAAWVSLNANVTQVSEKVTAQEHRMNALDAQIRAVDDKATTNLGRLQSDLSEVKGTLRGIDSNIQLLIRQNSPPPPR